MADKLTPLALPLRAARLDLQQIGAFERTVRLGGVHAAARHLGLTQPAVSQRLRELERTLGVALFLREGRSLRLTPDGAALLPYADQMLQTAQDIAARIGTGDPLRGVLRLGVSKSFAQVCLPSLSCALTRRHPSLRTEIHVGDSNTITTLLNELKLDLAVTSEYRMADHVHRELVGSNRHGWFAAASYLGACRIEQPADLATHHLVVTPPPSRTHTTAMQWFRRTGVVPQRLSTCDDLGATLGLIRDGAGIGLVPTRTLREEVAGGSVRQVVPEPAMPAYEVWICYQVEELGPGLRDVVDMVHAIVAQHALYR